MGRLEESDAAAAAVQKTPHRVTLDFLRSQVVDKEFYNPYLAPHVTICVILLANGFTVTGESAPADPANYDETLGNRLAEDAAVAKMWPLYGFLLREKLYQDEEREHADPAPEDHDATDDEIPLG